MINIDIHSENFNLITSGINNLEFDGIPIFSEWHVEESHPSFEHFLGSKDGIIERDISEIDVHPNEIFYFVYIRTHIVQYPVLCDVLEFGDEVSNQFLKLLKSKNVRTLIVDFHEVDDVHDISKFILKLKKKNINLKNINLINNDSNLKSYNYDIDLYKTNHLISNTAGALSNSKFDINHNKTGPFFLCKNKVGKPHRIYTLSFLDKHNMLSDTNFSILEPHKYLNHYNDEFETIISSLNIGEYVDKFLNTNPIHTNNELNRNDFFDDNVFIDYAGDLNNNDYLNSYVNITTESVFFRKNIHISEKSIKPFMFYQIPIMIASAGHVDILRKYYDLDLFDDLVNHSYDIEPDNTSRFTKVMNEIVRIYENREYVKEYYSKNKHRFEYNRNKIIELSRKGVDFDIMRDIIQKK